MAPSGNFPHCHPKGPLWRAEGRKLECFSCTKTPLNTHLRTHVHIAIFVGASQLFTEPLWHRYTLIEVTFVHIDMFTHAHIYTLNGHILSCVTLHSLPIYMYTYLPPPLITLIVYMSYVEPATMHTWTCPHPCLHVHNTVHSHPP